MLATSFRVVGLTALAVSAAGGAFAQTAGKNFFVRVGPAQLTLADDADFTLGGAPVAPPAGLETDPQWTLAVELGYWINDMFSVDLTLGLPPTAEATGTGNLAGLGKLGEVTYGPAALTGVWHANKSGPIDAYIGAGLAYMLITGTEDGSFTNIEASDDSGPVVQLGATYAITEQFAAFIDVKKAWLETHVTGNVPAFGGAPATADITMDPLVVNFGIQYNF